MGVGVGGGVGGGVGRGVGVGRRSGDEAVETGDLGEPCAVS